MIGLAYQVSDIAAPDVRGHLPGHHVGRSAEPDGLRDHHVPDHLRLIVPGDQLSRRGIYVIPELDEHKDDNDEADEAHGDIGRVLEVLHEHGLVDDPVFS